MHNRINHTRTNLPTLKFKFILTLSLTRARATKRLPKSPLLRATIYNRLPHQSWAPVLLRVQHPGLGLVLALALVLILAMVTDTALEILM